LSKKKAGKTFDQWRIEAGLSVRQLAEYAGVDRRTANKVKTNLPVQDVKASMMLAAISVRIGKKLSFEDVHNLNISKVERKGKDENLPASDVEPTDP